MMRSPDIPSEVAGGGRFVVERRDFSPAYLATYEKGLLLEKIDQALEALRSCALCPRGCRIDRWEKFAVCKVGRYARVSSFFPHFGEEDVLRGRRGSGTIFFSWCNLRCVFCQNCEISQAGEGKEAGPREIARMMLDLQGSGCHNINFVTPEHVVPQILEALPYAIEKGLHVPLVYNTSAYDSVHSLHLMGGVVDVYMPDFKMWDRERCRKYLLARNYAEAARAGLNTMHEQVGDLKVDEEGVALRGILVRHLVMPGMLEDTREIMKFIAGLSTDTYINLMDQYRPAWKVGREAKYAEIDRQITREELWEAFQLARQAGLWRFDSRWCAARESLFAAWR
jgi:putative pyruvate formate lyase activating enzyme